MKETEYRYIRTYTGLKFYPLSPEAHMIEIKDIAHALSYICRGNGHVSRFYSVAQHCINCALEAKARGCSKKVALACLLHDASEAYMSDVPRPFKRQLKGYDALEQKLIDIIFEKYLGGALTEEEERQLQSIDDDLLYFDLKELLKEEPEGEPPRIHIDLDYREIPFKEAEEKFLEMYEKLIYGK